MTRPGSPISPPPSRGSADSLVAYLIGPLFVVLAAWFVLGPETASIPFSERVAVNPADLATAPMRETMADPPTMMVAGFEKKCRECHTLFGSNPDTPLRLNQHANIVQAHGMNDRCFNCHDQESHDTLVLAGGQRVPFSETPLLCAKCHGTTYRDWQAGIHGRALGYWDETRGERIRLECTQCHDPHAPAFDPMTALAGPNTLRMSVTKSEGTHEAGKHNPLRRWSSGLDEPASPADHSGEEHH
ncbi:MAG: hypothetical protein HKN62_11555 [Phycisphaerales bacterium]|nr:hypothetical protein [Phycisphaerales bacterium]